MLMRWDEIIFYAFVAITVVQLFYYLFFFSRLAFYKPKSKQQSQQHPVSVIVCARDEDEKLALNLPGILVQEYPSTHEIIVVNDNSIDDSKYILAELQKTFRKLHVIELTQEAKHIKGKKYPLSVGIKEAKHEIVLLTDADCVPASEYWLKEMQDAFSQGIEIVLGYGGYYKQNNFLNRLIRWETFHSALQYMSFALAGVPYMGVGRNLAYKKDLFFRNKGFSSINHIPSGDDDLFINQVATKRNTAVVLDEKAFTLSVPKQTWKDWVRQKNRHYTTGKYYKSSHRFLLGLYAFSLFLFYPLFITSLIVFNWRWTLIPFTMRLLVQVIILNKAMKKLNESDLFKWFIFFDLWMIVHYLIFYPAIWKRPEKWR
ncbi:MAG: glycosyltransferase [Chitinophagaceae bacterium]|nr:glycosyltransferase [Chitinophagaceae bacterium]